MRVEESLCFENLRYAQSLYGLCSAERLVQSLHSVLAFGGAHRFLV